MILELSKISVFTELKENSEVSELRKVLNYFGLRKLSHYRTQAISSQDTTLKRFPELLELGKF